MAIRYSSGIGRLFDKGQEEAIIEIKYQLMETDATKYMGKKWWGDFSCGQRLERPKDYRMELEDGRKGDCMVSSNMPPNQRMTAQHYYSFFGRGSIDGRSKIKRRRGG